MISSQSCLALDSGALYAKSQVYISRGLRAKSSGHTDEYQLWASLALELLSKAALSRIHPALVADPNHFNSLFAACGRQITPDIKTIAAHTVFSRLPHLTKEFDSKYQVFCEQIAIRRNSELHSGDSPFSGMRPDVWEMEFWGAIEVILKCQDRNLESWLPSEEVKTSAEIVEKAKEALDWAVKNRVSRAREAFESKVKNSKDRAVVIEKSESKDWREIAGKEAVSHFDDFERYPCPSCGGSGFLAGQFWSEEIVASHNGWAEQDEYDSYSEPPWEEVEATYLIQWFICPVCKLQLHGSRENRAAGIPEEFKKTENRIQEFEPDYGND